MANNNINVILTQTELDALIAYGVDDLAVWDTNVTNLGTLEHLEYHGVDIPQLVIDFVTNANANNTSALVNYEERPVFYSESNNEERTTSTSFRTTHQASFPVEAGKSYIVKWNYEAANIKSRQIKIRVYVDGNLEQDLNFRSNFRNNYSYFESKGGFMKYDATENKNVDFQIQLAAERSGFEVRVRKLKLIVEQKEFV